MDASVFSHITRNMFSLRPYQTDIAQKAAERVNSLGIAYLAMGVRTGKSHTAMEAARICGASSVLFLTKKIAIKSITEDYKQGHYPFSIVIINHQSMHKAEGNFDFIIVDEAHQHAAFPKPSNSAKDIRKKYGHLPMIMLSGTPTPESFSQWYHQFYLSNRSPFGQYPNFYKWANDFVNKYQRNMGYATITLYDRASKEKIDPFVAPYLLTYTQEQAGFESQVVEHTIRVKMKPITYALIERLKTDLCIVGSEKTVTADSAVKLMSKIHQLGSGTIKFDDETAQTIDTTKADFIKERFKGIKIGVFYKFKEEWEMLKKVFGDQICNTLDEFNGSDKNIALQIVSGREGISLKEAKYLVYMTPDYSATSYWQSRARTQTIDRLETEVFWVFAENTIDEKVYKKVMGKKSYTTKHFLQDLGIKFPK